MQQLHYFIGERGGWSAEGLNERVIREGNVYVTEIVLRIKIPSAPEEASQEQDSGGRAGFVGSGLAVKECRCPRDVIIRA